MPALVSAFLAVQIGGKHSRDLLLTGRVLGAEDAYRMGLVNEVVPHEELAAGVQTLAETLLANSPQSLAATKRLMAQQNKEWLDAVIRSGFGGKRAIARELRISAKGVSAFLEKRKPMWKR